MGDNNEKDLGYLLEKEYVEGQDIIPERAAPVEYEKHESRPRSVIRMDNKEKVDFWFLVGNLSINIKALIKEDGFVEVSVYPKGLEDFHPIASTIALFNESKDIINNFYRSGKDD